MLETKAFKLENGACFAGITVQEYQSLLQAMQEGYGLHQLQIAESGAVGTAMVLRVALGLSAAGASLCAVIDDSLAGLVALASMRQLANAGAHVVIYTQKEFDQNSLIGSQLYTCYQAGVEIHALCTIDLPAVIETVEAAHALVFGIFAGPSSEADTFKDLCHAINEVQTPVHSITAPAGIFSNTKATSPHPVFSATTISLGVPLALLTDYLDCAGRLYVTDISIALPEYEKHAANLKGAFVSQPVVQFFPTNNDSS